MKNKVTKNKSDKSFEFGQVMTMLEQMSERIKVIAKVQKEINFRLESLCGKISVRQALDDPSCVFRKTPSSARLTFCQKYAENLS